MLAMAIGVVVMAVAMGGIGDSNGHWGGGGGSGHGELVIREVAVMMSMVAGDGMVCNGGLGLSRQGDESGVFL